MNLLHKANRVLIVGQSSTGKTEFFSRYVLNSGHDYHFIFDQEGEMPLRLGGRHARTAQDLFLALDARFVIFDPSDMFPGETAAGFDFFCDWCFEVSKQLPGTKLFAADELQKIIGTNTYPPEFALVNETGRRHGLDSVYISQQPNLIHNRTRAQMTEVVTFRMSDKRAMEWLVEYGFDDDEVRGLPDGQWIAIEQKSATRTEGNLWAGRQMSVKASG